MTDEDAFADLVPTCSDAEACTWLDLPPHACAGCKTPVCVTHHVYNRVLKRFECRRCAAEREAKS